MKRHTNLLTKEKDITFPSGAVPNDPPRSYKDYTASSYDRRMGKLSLKDAIKDYYKK